MRHGSSGDAPQTPRFGAELRRWRRAANLTQEQLAERSGLSPSTITHLERGSRRAPQAASAEMLVDALGLSGADRAEFFRVIESDRVPPGPRPAQGLSLPDPPWPIHGRDAALAQVEAMLAGGARWITLIGEGGIGKTRLALELAHRAAASGAPVFWVAAAALREPDEVLPALAAAARLPMRAETPLAERFARSLRGQPGLVVLDNLEHLLDVAPELQELLVSTPGLALLITSREAFGLREETVVTVDPLPMPAADAGAEIAENPAVRIFFERWQRIGAEPPNADDLAAAARIVRLLDGMPLAVELAAAQRATLTPRAVAELLGRTGIHALGRVRDGVERSRSMDQAIRWSVNLLPEDARALFRLLAVFRGGFITGAAQGVAAEFGRPAAMSALPALLSSSLVRETDSDSGDARFAMLEPVRMVAALELAAAGEEARARDSHAAWMTDAAVSASAAQLGAGGGEQDAHAFFAAERANLLAALDHLLATGQGSAAMSLANALGFWWEHTGAVREGYGWMRRVIDADDGTAPARDRWLARWLAGLLASYGGDAAALFRLARESLEIARDAGDLEGEAMAELLLALRWELGGEDLDGALARLDRAIDLAEVAMNRDAGAWLALAHASSMRATYRFYGAGETERPIADYNRALTILRAHGSLTLQGMPLVGMAAALQAEGRRAEALTAVQEALAIHTRFASPLVQVNAAMRMASLLSDEPEPAAAKQGARMLGALESMLERQGFREDDMMARENQATLRRLRAMLGANLDAAIAEGRSLADGAEGDPDLLALALGG